ncbi:uncharacterized protein LOC121052112 [Rosa chinensis]|uniref:uncharacterized protein LOC121052112 n=1 Tax=Rosa chinensis TaxID=74649 RepID=UPI001AD94622|nr:uncharacterized protein LOC121052112 [Rosa chinensis]
MGDSGTNWSTDEQIQLCDSWARKTVCPITDKHITSSKLWEKVHADYVQNWQGPPTSRTPQALQSQFRTLKRILKDWHNAQMTSRNRIMSGTNKMDEENQTHDIFMKKHPKMFDKFECWEKVKYHPYFVDPPSNSQPPASYSTTSVSENESPIDLDDEIVLETPSSSMPRPMGQKRAKEAKKKGKKAQDAAESMALAIQAMAESIQASVELVKKRNEEMAAHTKKVFEFEEAKENARIMAMDTNSMTPQSKAWWKKKKGDIVAKTMSDGGSSGCYIPQFD